MNLVPTNKQIGNHSNKDIINASISLSSSTSKNASSQESGQNFREKG
jgi:hypothetical protein